MIWFNAMATDSRRVKINKENKMNKSTIIYHDIYQKFTEFDSNGNIIKEGSFKIPEWSETIHENDRVTIIFLDDGSKGVAKLNPADSQNIITGRKIAYARARIAFYIRELKEAIRATHND